jgi:transposase
VAGDGGRQDIPSRLFSRRAAGVSGSECAFGYFGGVFRRLRYDNLKSVVKKILPGHNRREETERLIEFRST